MFPSGRRVVRVLTPGTVACDDVLYSGLVCYVAYARYLQLSLLLNSSIVVLEPPIVFFLDPSRQV